MCHRHESSDCNLVSSPKGQRKDEGINEIRSLVGYSLVILSQKKGVTLSTIKGIEFPLAAAIEHVSSNPILIRTT